MKLRDYQENSEAGVFSSFETNRSCLVVNCGVLTEGFDDAGVEVVAMARPTKSRALYERLPLRSNGREMADVKKSGPEFDRLGINQVEATCGRRPISFQQQPHTKGIRPWPR